MPSRLQRRRTKGWRMPEGVVYVGRPSKWGNPWPIDNVQSAIVGTYDWSGAAARTASIAMFTALAEYFRDTDPDEFAAWIAPLRGRDLVCWCRLDKPCHADVLLELANA